MSLMDDLDSEYKAWSVTLVNECGWEIKVMEGGWRNTKQYYIMHDHKGYSWPVVANLRGNSDKHRVISVKCSHCQAQVPEETLGFLELLKWER